MAVSALVALGASAATAATIVSVMTTIGTVMTVVGAVTGNKDLMKIGGIIGLVGAAGTIGSMASGAASAAAGGAAEAVSSVATEAAAPAVQTLSRTALDVGASSASGLEAVSSAIPVQPNLMPAALPPVDSAAQVASAAPVPTIDYGLNPAASAPLDMPAPNTAAPVAGQDAIIPQSAEVNTVAANGVQVQAPQDPMVNGDGVRINNPSAYTPAGYSPPNQFFDKISGMWNGLGERGKSQLIGAGASMFSGAQNAAQKEKELALQQQRLNQTSYGSAVPRLSIINRK